MIVAFCGHRGESFFSTAPPPSEAQITHQDGADSSADHSIDDCMSVLTEQLNCLGLTLTLFMWSSRSLRPDFGDEEHQIGLLMPAKWLSRRWT